MSEEEIIKEIQNLIKYYNGDIHEPLNSCFKLAKALQGLLDLYNKEKEKNEKLLDEAIVTYFDDEELKKSIVNYLEKLLKKNIQKEYISKDKIREKIEEYHHKDFIKMQVCLKHDDEALKIEKVLKELLEE